MRAKEKLCWPEKRRLRRAENVCHNCCVSVVLYSLKERECVCCVCVWCVCIMCFLNGAVCLSFSLSNALFFDWWKLYEVFVLSLFLWMFYARITTFNACVKFRFRIANRVGEDSCCRGGIVHIRSVCSRALLVTLLCPTALWRFRVSTSNSPSGRT